jgi:uncharacterized protein (UPF0332 family)
MEYTRFIALAQALKNASGNDPAAIRSAVSRIYYGILHKALGIIEHFDKPVLRETGHHQFVQKVLMNCGHADLRLAGSLLKDMHDERCNADYKISQTKYEDTKFAESVFLLADQVIELLDRSLASGNLSEIKIGITNYRKILGQ